MSDVCTCRAVKGFYTGPLDYEWNPQCPMHGRDSAWYNDPKQVETRQRYSAMLRELQLQAREARQRARADRDRDES